MTFQDSDLIYSYTRKQALADGEQVDCNIGDLAEVTRQHFKYPVYMTRSVFAIMERACSPKSNKRWGNDMKGVWHDICTMATMEMRYYPNDDSVNFQVIITGAGRNKYWDMIATCSATDIDDPAPCITIMLPEDD